MPTRNPSLNLLPDSIRSEAAVAFRDLASGLYTTSSAANLANKALKPLQLYAKTGDSLVKKIKDLDQKIKAVEKAADYLDDKPIVGPIAKALKPIAEALATWSTRTKAELLNLSETQRKIGKVIEPIAETLSKVDKFGLVAGVTADTFSRKLAVAGQQLEDAKQLFDTDIPFFGNDESTKQKILLRIGEAQADAAEVALDVSQITAVLKGLQNSVDGIGAFVDNPVFRVIEEFEQALSAVGNALSPVFSPIQKVYNALEPVLDALDSIFGWILKPLEWALEAVISATGINSVIEAIGNELLKILPDTSFLNGIIAELEKVFLTDMQNYYEQKIIAPFDSIRVKLEGVDFPNQFAIATSGDDTLMGALNSSGSLTLDGLAGDDILLGSDYGDTLRGGSGMDILVGGGGDDLLDGGSNLADEPDFAMYSGSINDYGLVSILENGFASGTWFVTDLRSDTSVEGISDRSNLGTDELRNVEVLVFDDTVLDLREIDTYILTHSTAGDLAQVSPTFSTVEFGGRKAYTADGGIDLIFGALGLDILETGAGNDQLSSGSNAPLTVTTWGAEGDVLRGGEGNDIYIPGPRSGEKDTIEDAQGNDTVDYRLSEYGLTVFLGSSQRELLYRPNTILIDADPVGYTTSALNYAAGLITGIENLIGTKFNDVLIGSDEVNKISGGAGNDQIRGLDGDDILRGGDGNDTLIGDGGNDYLEGGSGSNSYVAGLGNDYIVDLSSSYSQVFYAVSAKTDHYSVSVNFVEFTTTGESSLTPNNMPGAIVIVPSDIPHKQQVSKYATSISVGDRYGIDDLEGVERIVGSNGHDIIYTAEGMDQTIYGNEGDDKLYTVGSTKNNIYAGPGDDFFISNASASDTFFGGAGSDVVRIWGDNNVDGDVLYGDDNRQTALPGIDTLDFSNSDYSWHIYMNPISNGVFTGKAPLSGLYDSDPHFTQPTLGVNGTVVKKPGVSVFGEVYPGVNFELRVADANTSNPGGRATSVGEFERIIGSQHRDFITGGSPDGAVTIDGQGGDDVLFASQLFASVVEGGEGNDVLGTFNHTLGSDGAKGLFNSAIRAVLNGGNGNDVFVAGDFQEQFNGGEGIDLLTYEVSTAGVNVDLISKTLSGGNATGDTLVGGIINVTGSAFNDSITGDGLQNELVGWDGGDVIRGMGGSDQLFGNDGDDQIYGGSGNDMLHGGNGADLLDGGEGTDTASWNLYQLHPKGGINRLTNDSSGVVADLQTGKAGQDTLVSIENLIGGVGNDQLFGDDGDNFLGGNAGNDLLDGRGGNDVLLGSRGDDTLRGGDGDDFLSGGAGINVLDGGDGTDSIDYSSLDYGVTVVMAGVGTRTNASSGEVTSLTPVDAYVWTDSLKSVAGPTGLAGDVIKSGTSEVRFTYQILDKGTDDPSDDTRLQEDPITPERIWKLNPLFAESPEDLFEVRYLPDEGLLAEQEVSLVSEYVASSDVFTSIERIIGSKGDDVFTGNAESTFFYGGAGADSIDGGAGIDTSRYLGQKSNFVINTNGQGLIVQDNVGAEGKDTLVNVERLVFEDSALAFDIDGNAGFVAKLLITLIGKDNWRNPEYVKIGLDMLENNGLSPLQLMDMALEVVLGSNPTNEAVVNLVYSNVVGALPPPADLALYSGLIADGSFTQESLAMAAATHAVTEDYIQVIGLANTGLEYIA